MAITNMSQQLIPTRKEAPSKAETLSNALLIRGGYISQLISGVYSYLPIGLRIKNNIINIVREEMNSVGCNEILMPALQPREYWSQSDRDIAFGEILFSLSDRKKRNLVLGPTHEEVVSQLFAENVETYKQLPITLYQIQTKFRDEARPRGGLVRTREFTMKDAYSFDIDEDALNHSYEKMVQAYEKIFHRCGIPVVKIEADSGAIGGKGSQEFIFLNESGEDTVVLCSCGYAANEEKASIQISNDQNADVLNIEKVETNGLKTIEELSNFFDMPKKHFIKSVFYIGINKEKNDVPFIAFTRGDLEINEVKLANLSNLTHLRQMSEEETKKYNIVSGYAGPHKLKSEILSIADDSLSNSLNLIAGANEENSHYKNINFRRDWNANIFGDIKLATEGSLCHLCGKKLELKRGIELGHVFKLGSLYSEKFNIKISGPNQQTITPIMGCYGIGIDRILACASENHITENSLNWPMSIAPYNIHIVDLNENIENKQISDSIKQISQYGINILLDDREETPGKKFADADLIGIPIKIILSDRNLKKNQVEIINRSTNETSYAPIETFYKDVINLYDQLIKECSI